MLRSLKSCANRNSCRHIVNLKRFWCQPCVTLQTKIRLHMFVIVQYFAVNLRHNSAPQALSL